MSAEDHQRHYTAATDEGAIIAVVDFESGHEIELEVQLTPEQAEAVWKSGPAFVEALKRAVGRARAGRGAGRATYVD